MRSAIAARNAALNAMATRMNSGKLRVYSGTRPATADTALSGNTLLAELTLNATAFATASSGVITANAITADSSADNTGTASFVRITQSDGTTVEHDLSVSVSGGGGEAQFSTLAFVAGAVVSMSSLTITASVGS